MTPPLDPADQYHAGIVVADLDTAIERLTAVGGYRWTTPMAYTVPVVTAAGPMDMPFRLVYSLDAPHLEVVQEVPGTVWTSAPGNAVHHLGFWADDVEATGERLERAGYSLEVRAGGATPTFAYYRDLLGVRIEIVERSMFGDWPGFLRSMAGS
ncbi:VOC family protein [Mycolicibacterium palauense]|uniref:VOC family protein n=1 Tax=Mycolicibacterium palauense TaxID=2034511 RepID=UPI000BFEACFD|nr:VOC family protein [Mycolicibacterium palauense]